MLYLGMDLSRTRLDVCVMDDDGAVLEESPCPPDADGLVHLVRHIARRHSEQEVLAVIESMNGARFVHDTLELGGWSVEVADAQKVKGLAPRTGKTDHIDARVLAELSRRDLVPAIWLPTPEVRGVRELARWRLHLVRRRSALNTASMRPCSPSATSVRCRTSSAQPSGAARTPLLARAVDLRRRRRALAHRHLGRPDR